MKFRKKPVVIEACLFNTALQCTPWLTEAMLKPWGNNGAVQIQEIGEKPLLLIWTLEGMMEANVGDWIIQGVKGEFYPCKPDIFEATYEPVE